jgi:hypothetical protein
VKIGVTDHEIAAGFGNMADLVGVSLYPQLALYHALIFVHVFFPVPRGQRKCLASNGIYA